MRDLFVGDSGQSTLLVAEREGRIVGFSQSRAERFGPFGVDPAERGQGVGAVLLDATPRSMRGRGYHVAWFLWTEERAARLYRQVGFEEVRRFSLFERHLAERENDNGPGEIRSRRRRCAIVDRN
jgi:mycothiol synthase